MTDVNIEKFLNACRQSLSAENFIKLTLGNYKGSEPQLQKIFARLAETKKGIRMMMQYRYATRETARNFEPLEAIAEVAALLDGGFRSAHLFTTESDVQLTIGKRNSRIITAAPTIFAKPELTHDRTKTTIVDPNAVYLKAIGIVTDKGEIKAKQADKWKQINKFVEILDGIFRNSPLKDAERLSIVDMGSGKGYLTFAGYDHFANTLGLQVSMTGVDTKGEIVELCNGIADAAGFEGLRFVHGTISKFDVGDPDIVIALHACDTATDDALYKGIAANAAVIIAAPCCHKEIRPQIKPPEMLRDVLKHGTLLERTAETLTDGIRSLLLERSGYSTKVFEFVPSEHTPKNNMIAATRNLQKRNTKDADEQLTAIKEAFGISSQRLESLLFHTPESLDATHKDDL